MNEHDEIRLLEYLDDQLDAPARAAVEAWLATDPEARRQVAQHRRAWTLLGDLDIAGVGTDGAAHESDSAVFRRRTVEAVDRERRRDPIPWPQRVGGLLAAGVLVAVAAFAWFDRADDAVIVTLDETDRRIVGHLQLLEQLDFLEANGDDLDFAHQVEVFEAFDGEVGR